MWCRERREERLKWSMQRNKREEGNGEIMIDAEKEERKRIRVKRYLQRGSFNFFY
jgi:hypothetical protein